MKKLFYLLFISFALASCTKDEPIEADEPIQVACTCDGANNGSNSSSFNCDTSLVGLWVGSLSLPGNNVSYGFFINESGTGYYNNGVNSYSGYYDCSDGFFSFIETSDYDPYCLSGNYSITGNTMILDVVVGQYNGYTYTLTKQ
tara:strand:- start:548 stop:979 length:432 start_codon:yes stop_codon:yes gene_type:complete